MANLAHAHPPVPFDHDDDDDVLIQFDDNAFEAASPFQENYEDQVRAAQEQLAQLRQREEELERQKRELEELHQKKESFLKGRSQLSSELNRAIALLDREGEDAQRRADQCVNSRQSLEHYLRAVESIRPETWGRNQLRHELTRGQAQLDEAEEELSSTSALVSSIKGGRKPGKAGVKSDPDTQGFVYWFRSGLAFTLPAMIFGAVFAMIFLIFGGS